MPQCQAAWKAPHFVWYVREELRERLCGEAETCDILEQGGLRVVTTLDFGIQQSAEKWIAGGHPRAASRGPGCRGPGAGRALRALDAAPARPERLERRPLGHRLRARRDHRLRRLGQLLRAPQGQPQDAAAVRRPLVGLASAGLGLQAVHLRHRHRRALAHGGHDAHGRHHRLRRRLRAHRLQRPGARPAAGPQRAAVLAQHPGRQGARHRRRAGRLRAGPGLRHGLPAPPAHGRPGDGPGQPGGPPARPQPAYATLANGGRNPGVTSILQVTNTDGDEVLPPHTPPKGERVISEQAAFVVTDILAGNTDPAVNPIWAASRITTPSGQRRPAALKTGTTNDAKDLNAYGYIAPPSARGRQRGEYALSVGVWAGNSDSSPVTTVANPVFSLDVAAPIWDAFLSEVTRGWEVRDFARPDGLTTAGVDVFTGSEPSQWSREQTTEFFLRGTAPGKDPYLRGLEVVRGPDGGTYLWEEGCEGQPRTRGYLVLDDAESAFPSWNAGRPGLAQAGAPGCRRGRQRLQHQAHLHGLLLRALLPALRSDLGRPLRARRAPAAWHPRPAPAPRRRHPLRHRRRHRCRRRSPPRRRRLPRSHPSPRRSPRRSPRNGHGRPRAHTAADAGAAADPEPTPSRRHRRQPTPAASVAPVGVPSIAPADQPSLAPAAEPRGRPGAVSVRGSLTDAGPERTRLVPPAVPT